MSPRARIAKYWPELISRSCMNCVAAPLLRMPDTRHSPYVNMGKPSNAAAALRGRNPQGQGDFGAVLRCASLIWNNQISLLAPWPAPKSHTVAIMQDREMSSMQ